MPEPFAYTDHNNSAVETAAQFTRSRAGRPVSWFDGWLWSHAPMWADSTKKEAEKLRRYAWTGRWTISPIDLSFVAPNRLADFG